MGMIMSIMVSVAGVRIVPFLVGMTVGRLCSHDLLRRGWACHTLEHAGEAFVAGGTNLSINLASTGKHYEAGDAIDSKLTS